MSNLLEHVTAQENLWWAWLKAKRMYETDDMLTDDLEVADFEIHIEESLASIAEDLRVGGYQFRPLIPLAHPKGKDKDGNHCVRQSFKAAVRDQVAWIALVNIIGPSIEKKMPPWSYGNRLYRQLFFEPGTEGEKHLRFGHFRHARGELYRPFHQAWPVYRRHILFTARKMTGDRIILDDRDEELLEMELQTERLPYLHKDWWKRSYREVYWAGIDFRRFYPTIRLEVVHSNLCRFCDYAKDEVEKLADQLLLFPLATCDWPDNKLRMVGLSREQKYVKGLPTGLFVSGFLANVAMLEIDDTVHKQLQNRQIAQFRYVDDHTILAPTYSDLNAWLDEYLRTVKDKALGAEINDEKTEPEALAKYRECREKDEMPKDLLEKAADATRINIQAPTPLLTKTLAKVSMIARVEVDLLTAKEQDSLLADIEQLLLTEFPVEELRPDTRMSFAMSQLCKVAARRFLHSKETWQVEQEIAEFIDRYGVKESPDSTRLRSLQSNRDHAIDSQFAHLFEFLKMTLERYPDRPRLWAKAVRFCMHTGYAPGLKGLFDLLQKVDDLDPLSIDYLALFILQCINRHFLQAMSAILSSDRPLCQRSAAVRFANACYEVASAVRHTELENSSVFRLHSECRRAYWHLAKCMRSRRHSVYDLEETHTFLCKQGLLTTLPAAEKPMPNLLEGQEETAAYWHVDSRITPFVATCPSFYWRTLAPRLAPSRGGNAVFLAKWPQFLPSRARDYFCLHSGDGIPGRRGWLVDVCTASVNGASGGNAVLLESLSPSPEDSRDHMTLNDWVRFARTLPPWDPRRSEWTALEIVRGSLASRLSFGARDQKHVPLVPYNILVPRVWQDDPSSEQSHTWESWQDVVKRSALDVRLRSARVIDDDRYSPHWWTSATSSDPWEDVYSCGLVLLGLLRLSFALPCSWNPRGQARFWSGGMGRILGELPCSSWTLAILQSTLLPKNRETFVLRRLDQSQFCRDDDTVDDPPEIHNLDKLEQLLEQSQRVLRKYRVTVQSHKPRQLIPLSLDQIGKTLFESQAGGDD